jgi:uncharacterized iron-regulated membrane protein
LKTNKRIRLIFKVHSYTGLITGIALLLIGLSGSILVFARDLDHLIYRDILEVEPKGIRISLDSGYHLMQGNFPDMNYITYDGIPQEETSAYQFFMMKDGVQYKVFLNPYTSEILHHGKRHEYLMDWLLLFHYTFMIPIWGELAAALLSIMLLISITTGAIVYRKYIIRVFLFKIPFKDKNWRTLSSSFHRIVGVWSLVFHVLIAITAFWMMRYTFSESHYNHVKLKNIDAPVVAYSIDNTLATIKEKYPEFHAVFLTLPEEEGVPSYIYGHSDGTSFFYADYYDEIQTDGHSIKAKFLKDKTIAEKCEGMVYPVHAGLYGNFVIKIIYCLGGITPALLSITGFLLWWRRKS